MAAGPSGNRNDLARSLRHLCRRRGARGAAIKADRRSLPPLLSLSATMERVLEERSRKLILPPVNDAAAEAQLAATGEASANIQAPLPRPTQSELRRQRRLARYEEVVALFQSGHSQAAISKALGLQRKDHPALATRWHVS